MTQTTTPEAVNAETTTKVKKARKVHKMTREILLLQEWSKGERDAVKLAQTFQDAAEKGLVSVRPSMRKLEANSSLYVAQVKWYYHEAMKKGKITGELVTPFKEKKARAKKEKVAKETTSSKVTTTAVDTDAEDSLGGTL